MRVCFNVSTWEINKRGISETSTKLFTYTYIISKSRVEDIASRSFLFRLSEVSPPLTRPSPGHPGRHRPDRPKWDNYPPECHYTFSTSTASAAKTEVSTQPFSTSSTPSVEARAPAPWLDELLNVKERRCDIPFIHSFQNLDNEPTPQNARTSAHGRMTSFQKHCKQGG